ncbi:MAG: helix-turn-helix domain containing protein, partial [Clostridia bacterium]
IFQNTGLMIGRLHSRKTPEYMASSIDYFEKILETDFEKLFSVLLTDRGSEFYKPELFETKAENVDDSAIRCNLFYCDPQTPSQKPHVENNHNFVREILPNGMNWTNLTQEKVDLMFSHINSVARFSLGGKTPFEVFSYIYNEDILTKLNIRRIEKDKVILKPYLLK